MKGAIAEPLTSMSNPPNTTIMISTGNSQYFLRTRMNRQSSATKSMLGPLKLISHGLRQWPRRLPLDPVAVCVRLPLKPQWVLACQAHRETGRQNRTVEQQCHHDGADEPLQQQSEFEPHQVERMQDPRPEQCRRQKQRSQSARPRPYPSRMPEIQRADDGKPQRHHQSERTVGSGHELFLTRKIFVARLRHFRSGLAAKHIQNSVVPCKALSAKGLPEACPYANVPATSMRRTRRQNRR